MSNEENKTGKMFSKMFLAISAAVLLLAAGGFFLYHNNSKNNTKPAEESDLEVDISDEYADSLMDMNGYEVVERWIDRDYGAEAQVWEIIRRDGCLYLKMGDLEYRVEKKVIDNPKDYEFFSQQAPTEEGFFNLKKGDQIYFCKGFEKGDGYDVDLIIMDVPGFLSGIFLNDENPKIFSQLTFIIAVNKD